MRILVTGGAGYIGSHTIQALVAQGHNVIALDNLERGHAVAAGCPIIRADLRDRDATLRVLENGRFDAVMHFAAYAAAGESVLDPDKYLANNVGGAVNLLNAMVATSTRLLVFSSSCAVYGQARELPVTERCEPRPESPYGESKYLVERMLPFYEHAHKLRTVALRYFNAAGASLDGTIGDDSRPATRLIPVAMKAALGRGGPLTIYGDDYPTTDGTCIRDYIHVVDLASAHLLALNYLADGGAGDVFNVGVGVGHSNLEVVEMIRRVAGVAVPVRFGPRRVGDPTAVYADSTKIRQALHWQPKHSDLDTIIRSDWSWHSTHPDGYAWAPNGHSVLMTTVRGIR
jgi:UDP-glucose 4-epimerase